MMTKGRFLVLLGLLLAVVLALFFSPALFFKVGGGGSEQYAPESVQAGEPVTIGLVVNVWGQGSVIQDRYKNVVLKYKLTDEAVYKVVDGASAPLEKYKKVTLDPRQWEAYDFTLPPVSTRGAGEIIYEITLELDGQPTTLEGIKKIKVVPAP